MANVTEAKARIREFLEELSEEKGVTTEDTIIAVIEIAEELFPQLAKAFNVPVEEVRASWRGDKIA